MHLNELRSWGMLTFRESYDPLSIKEYFERVMVPEIAIMLIMADRFKYSTSSNQNVNRDSSPNLSPSGPNTKSEGFETVFRKADVFRHQSIEYGRYLLEDEDEMEILQRFKDDKHARKRRTEEMWPSISAKSKSKSKLKSRMKKMKDVVDIEDTSKTNDDHGGDSQPQVIFDSQTTSTDTEAISPVPTYIESVPNSPKRAGSSFTFDGLDTQSHTQSDNLTPGSSPMISASTKRSRKRNKKRTRLDSEIIPAGGLDTPDLDVDMIVAEPINSQEIVATRMDTGPSSPPPTPIDKQKRSSHQLQQRHHQYEDQHRYQYQNQHHTRARQEHEDNISTSQDSFSELIINSQDLKAFDQLSADTGITV